MKAWSCFPFRVNEQLEGGESLLPVHHNALLNRPCGKGVLLKHDRAHEVAFGVFAVNQRLCQVLDIFPKWFPLLVLSPHIAALKVGNLIPYWLSEEPLGYLEVGLHGRFSRPIQGFLCAI